MLYALSIGELFDGVEIIMAISRQIFGNSEEFTLMTCVTQLWLRTGQACSNSSLTSSTDSSNLFGVH